MLFAFDVFVDTNGVVLNRGGTVTDVDASIDEETIQTVLNQERPDCWRKLTRTDITNTQTDKTLQMQLQPPLLTRIR